MDSAVSQFSLQEEAFDLLPGAAMVVDRSGGIVLANQAMTRKLEDLTGRAACRGRSLDQVFARSPEFLMSDLRAAASGGRLILWLRDVSEDVSGRMCFEVVAMLGNRMRAEHFMLLEDKSKPVSRVFSELNSKLRRANEKAAEVQLKHRQLNQNYEVLEQFSLVAAHDLKAPLLNISLLLEFLQEEYGAILDGPAQDLIVAAKDSASRLQNLISALLNHARSGATRLNIVTMDVASAVDKVRSSLAGELREAGGEIRIVGDLGTAEADSDLFSQLLQNIIGNALKYRARNRAPVVRIERVPRGDRSDSLVISDNGRGFDPAEKDRLFEPFKRLSSGVWIEGTGIGLAICKTVCERHGWTIDASGIPEVGSRLRDRRDRGDAPPTCPKQRSVMAAPPGPRSGREQVSVPAG